MSNVCDNCPHREDLEGYLEALIEAALDQPQPSPILRVELNLALDFLKHSARLVAYK